MSVDLHDDREYAWLLVRSGTVTDELVKIWQYIPIRSGSFLGAVVGYPLRLLLVVSLFALSGASTLVALAALAQAPVALFALVRPALPDTLWLVLAGGLGIALALHLALATGVWLHTVARGKDLGDGVVGALRDHLIAAPVDPDGGWSRWTSLHVGHESARSGLFAGASIALGCVLQCLAVLAGPEHFTGPADVAWRWPLTFGEQLVSTMLLGIPEGILPTFGGIEPTTVLGRLLLVGVDVCYAAGVIAFGVMAMASLFKVRELFNGTTRDLADYLENFDLSRSGTLVIHRVAVVHPLDEGQVVSVTKEELFRRVAATAEDAP